MSIERENSEKRNKELNENDELDENLDTPDVPTQEGRNEINSSDSAGAQENVVSSANADEKDHGRAHKNPITGANPKTI